jgi:methionyl-tRNA synthetase
MSKTFYVTTPIYYVTAKPHLGSLYSTLLADVAARWQKLQAKEVFFLTGTDEHGQKVAQAAYAVHKDPQEFVDSFIPAFEQTWAEYAIAYNHFIRTTDPSHVRAVQYWIAQLMAKGDIYKSLYQGWYCTPCETFVTEDQTETVVCPSCERPTHWVSEESYFFKLSAYQERLLRFYEENPQFIVPRERAHEVINFVKAGLKDLSISRTSVEWGIPFPGDPQHVVYVWADALNNYITAIGYGDPARGAEFKHWWPADLQIIGKDIVRFHAIFWPAFLMAAGLAMPRRLLVHGWIKVGQQKMSKSLGNVVDPQQLYTDYGADAVRYYLVRQLAINHDSEFSSAELEQKIATDLANDLGNLLHRMTTLAHIYDYYNVTAPTAWSAAVVDMRDQAWTMLAEYNAYMEECQFHMALASMWKFINKVNAYFHAHEPWKIAKHDQHAFKEIIAAVCYSLRVIGIVLWPVMPNKMEQLLDALGHALVLGKDYYGELRTDVWMHHTFLLKKMPPLFEKSVAEEKDAFMSEAVVPEISFEDFARAVLCVGTVTACVEVPRSDKLYQLTVDCGPWGIRTILSGVRKYFLPDELVGKQGVFVLNLAPRSIMGLTSQGMMLFAEDTHKKLQMVTVSASVPNGTQLR